MVSEPDNCFALFYFVNNAYISHVIITLIRYFLIPKSRDLVSHNPGISGLKNGLDCNPYSLASSVLAGYSLPPAKVWRDVSLPVESGRISTLARLLWRRRVANLQKSNACGENWMLAVRLALDECRNANIAIPCGPIDLIFPKS